MQEKFNEICIHGVWRSDGIKILRVREGIYPTRPCALYGSMVCACTCMYQYFPLPISMLLRRVLLCVFVGVRRYLCVIVHDCKPSSKPINCLRIVLFPSHYFISFPPISIPPPTSPPSRNSSMEKPPCLSHQRFISAHFRYSIDLFCTWDH